MDVPQLWLALVDAAVDAASRRAIDGTVDTADVRRSALKLSAFARSAEYLTFMTTLAERFDLSELDELALWTLVAQQLNPVTASRLGALAGGALDLGTLSMVAYGGVTNAAVTALSGARGMLRVALIEVVSSSNAQTWAQRSVRISDRVLRIALEADVELPDVACELSFHDDDVDLDTRVVVRKLDELVVDSGTVERAREAIRTGSSVIIASAIPGSGRRALLLALAAESGHRVLCLDAQRIDRDRDRAQHQIRAFARECTLSGRLPLIANVDVLKTETEDRFEWVGRELDARLPGVVLATCGLRTPATRWRRPTYVIPFGRPTTAQRERHWESVLHGTDGDAESLAHRYAFAPALVERIGDGLALRALHGAVNEAALLATIRGVIEDRLSAFATRIEPTQKWADLVLPADQLAAIVELRARIRGRSHVYEQWGFGDKVGRGLGVSALFSGPPGTGKTMVASLLASELELELYQVDLGKVVSKYIGETEKNLAALFDAAEASCALLLFDEADSLFGKRTDVKSSNDRYANLETNYLLQRLESFSGVCLLTTNHETAIDEAFMRRLSMHVRFDMPDAPERERLWVAMFPSSAPLDDGIDFKQLATRYVMSGGYIRNAALRAAFIAYDARTWITAKSLEVAARREYEAMGKIASNY
ncbi:MAG: AAA family ATPase [Myxococcota bacterium]|nr:AAA family ATPase [Myxococcota bacterium]